jgi:hypothetical protein
VAYFNATRSVPHQPVTCIGLEIDYIELFLHLESAGRLATRAASLTVSVHNNLVFHNVAVI